jgi:hypothetical protein
MTSYDSIKINEFIDKGTNATTTTEKGKALEDLVVYIFEKIPGVEIYETDVMNFHLTEELDVVLWNEKEENGLKNFPEIIFIECKNLATNVSTHDLAYFITKVRNKGLNFGILIASIGITGSENRSTRAHFEIPLALRDGIRIIVITIEDIVNLSNVNDLLFLIKSKICRLHVKGSIEL